MVNLTVRDVEYTHDGTRMIGYFCVASAAHSALAAQPAPGIVLIHDAFGLGDDMMRTAERYAGLGFAVLAADVWGERTVPETEPQIGPLIGGMASDREKWMGRIAAAHTALAAQPEVDESPVTGVGYCFGASSALEYLRTGADIGAVVSIHAGLDLLADDWSGADAAGSARVLLCTGADDPMATAAMREQLQSSLSTAGADWELDLYSNTKHAFTNPKSDFSPMPHAIAYNPQSAQRAWLSTERFLGEIHRKRNS